MRNINRRQSLQSTSAYNVHIDEPTHKTHTYIYINIYICFRLTIPGYQIRTPYINWIPPKNKRRQPYAYHISPSVCIERDCHHRAHTTSEHRTTPITCWHNIIAPNILCVHLFSSAIINMRGWWVSKGLCVYLTNEITQLSTPYIEYRPAWISFLDTFGVTYLERFGTSYYIYHIFPSHTYSGYVWKVLQTNNIYINRRESWVHRSGPSAGHVKQMFVFLIKIS